jgi:Domain of unknown function (DUF4145)
MANQTNNSISSSYLEKTPIIVQDCPRCHAKNMTFEVLNILYINDMRSELFCKCRGCHTSTVFNTLATPKGMGKMDNSRLDWCVKNEYILITGFVSNRHHLNIHAPEHIPDNIKTAFEEAVICLSVSCYNASVAMFRLCLDLATKSLLPEENENGLNKRHRELLKPRLDWLFENNKLAIELKDFSDCIREDGNDAAHDGNLTKAEAEDILDFTTLLLERLYTTPKKLEINKELRIARRNPQT